MENNKLKQDEAVKKAKNKTTILRISACIFYALGIITVLYALILLINGDLEFGDGNDSMIFFGYFIGGIFIASWGVLLDGIDKIVKNTSLPDKK